MVTAEEFIEKAKIPLLDGWGYIYGTWGTQWTAKKQAASTREMTVRYGSKWIGKMVTDCSGLLRWALKQLGENIVHHARYQYTDYCDHKGKLVNGHREDGQPILPGTAVFLQGKEKKIHHVGVYVGGDVCIEAKGTIYGVVSSHLNHWDHWGELNMVDYTNAGELETGEPGSTVEAPEDAEAGTIIYAIVDNPNTWLNVHNQPSDNATRIFQVKKGSIVEVLDAGEPDWWQIRYGGRIGWAFAKYLKPIEQPKPDEPEQPDDDTEDDPDEPFDDEPFTEDQLDGIIAAIGKIQDGLDELRKVIDEIKGVSE